MSGGGGAGHRPPGESHVPPSETPEAVVDPNLPTVEEIEEFFEMSTVEESEPDEWEFVTSNPTTPSTQTRDVPAPSTPTRNVPISPSSSKKQGKEMTCIESTAPPGEGPKPGDRQVWHGAQIGTAGSSSDPPSPQKPTPASSSEAFSTTAEDLKDLKRGIYGMRAAPTEWQETAEKTKEALMKDKPRAASRAEARSGKSS